MASLAEKEIGVRGYLTLNEMNNGFGRSGDCVKYGRWMAIYKAECLNINLRQMEQKYLGQPWCAEFISYVAYISGIDRSVVPVTSDTLKMGETSCAYNEWQGISQIKRGDVIFFSPISALRGLDGQKAVHHVAIVVNSNVIKGKLVIVHGNSFDDVVKRSLLHLDDTGRILAPNSWKNEYIAGYISV